MSLTKVNISWKQSPCYTCTCLLKVYIPPFQWRYWIGCLNIAGRIIDEWKKWWKSRFFWADFWAQHCEGKSHCLAVTFSEIHFSHCSWVLPSANVEIMAGDEQTLANKDGNEPPNKVGGAGWTLNYQAATGGFPFASSHYWYFCQLVEVKI